MYKYWGFGLTIASEIEFPELLSHSFETSDVTIHLGKTPETLAGDDVVHRVRVSISPLEYLLKALHIANYYVVDGSRIIVEPMPGADYKSIRLFLLGSGMAAILHQRNMVPLHTSAIEHGDGIILFCGRSGAGKSTTLSMLKQKGYKVFTDDICVLRYSAENTGQIEALSSYPMIKLWEDSFAKLNIEMAGEDKKIRPQLPKYAHFYHNEFNTTPKSIKQVFVLETNNLVSVPVIKKTSPIEAFSLMQQNTYRHLQMNAMNKRKIHFDMVSKITATIPVYTIKRPNQGNSILQLTALIESYFPVNG